MPGDAIVDLPHCGSLLDEATRDKRPSNPPDVTGSLEEYDLLLGVTYRAGRGVPQNQTLAARWFAKAASLGSVPAALAESKLYVEPAGLPQNLPKAIAILDAVTKLALDGSIRNLCEPAKFQGHNEVTAPYRGIGAKYEGRGPGSYPQAMEAYNKAAALGDGAPIIALGLRYANGKALPKNLDKAQTILLGLTKSSSIGVDDREALSVAIRTVAGRIAARKNPADAARIALLTQAFEREAMFVCPASADVVPPGARCAALRRALPQPAGALDRCRLADLHRPGLPEHHSVRYQHADPYRRSGQQPAQVHTPGRHDLHPIDVALIAPGITFAPGTTNTATLILDANNPNSTPATFQVQAPSAPEATELIATLSYHQTFLAQIARNISITGAITTPHLLPKLQSSTSLRPATATPPYVPTTPPLAFRTKEGY